MLNSILKEDDREIFGIATMSLIEDDLKVSKFLSYVLRHKPEEVGISLDSNGWVSVDELLSKAAQNGRSISKEQLERVVANNDKKAVCIQ